MAKWRWVAQICGLLVMVLALAACTGLQPGGAIAVATPTPAALQTPAGANQAAPPPAAAGTGPGQAAATPAPPPGWRVYHDQDAGYTVMLPPGVDLRTGQSKTGIYTARLQFHLPGVAGYQGMLIRVEPNPQKQGIEELLPAIYELFGQDQAPADLAARVQALTVTGLSAVRLSGPGTDFAIVVPYGNKVYIMSPVHDLAFAAADPQTLDLFDQVLQTFRLTE